MTPATTLPEGEPSETQPARRQPGWLRPALPATVLLVLVALLVGGLGAWLALRPNHPGDDSTEAGFARDMSTHHQQAVEMSLLVLERSDSREIITLATDIATTQGNQVGRMQGWLIEWGLRPTGREPVMAWMTPPGSDPADHLVNGQMPGMATPSQLESLRQADGEEAEILYLQLMTTHHIAGVQMAEALLPTTGDPEVSHLASTMVQGQQSEIDLMHGYLQDRGAEPQEELGELQGDDGTGTLPPAPSGDPSSPGHGGH